MRLRYVTPAPYVTLPVDLLLIVDLDVIPPTNPRLCPGPTLLLRWWWVIDYVVYGGGPTTVVGCYPLIPVAPVVDCRFPAAVARVDLDVIYCIR